MNSIDFFVIYKFLQSPGARYRVAQISVTVLLRPRGSFLDAMASDRSYKYVTCSPSLYFIRT